jgi:hypothetical protein
MPSGTDPQPGSLQEQAVTALLDVIKTASSPDIAQAQALLLRRLALEGDVVGSRIPAPRNITEIGGYINLLGDFGQPEMRAQMLAGALGVSGPNPQLGWLAKAPPLSWTSITNDRPAGPAQPQIPLTVTVRSDFTAALQAVLKQLHDRGCALPLQATARSLPPLIAGASPPDDVLPLLGRTLEIVASAALADPENDPVAVARKGTDPFAVVARVLAAGSVAVTSDAWDALKCDASSCTVVPPPATGRAYVAVGPMLAGAGFYPASPGVQPTKNSDSGWARFTNITGLIPGSTRLGDELALLYSTDDIAASILATRVSWVWNGTTFVAP